VNQLGVAVKIEDDGFVQSEQGAEITICQPVGMLRSRL
jgi:hypothetical protein